ncbi:MAG: cell division protein FtsX [Nitrospirota bacterium]
MRGYGPIFYFIEAYRGLRSNSLVNMLALGTITMAMLIVGFFLVVFLNLRTAVGAMGERLEASVYLKEGLTQQEQEYLLTRLKAEPGVKKVAFLPKADALALLKKELRGQEALMEGLGENPLPDSYEVAIDPQYADAAKMEALTKRIAKLPGVDDVSYGRQGVEVLDKLLKLVTWGGISLAVLLGVTVVFIISNSVRLALYSRGQEIELMQWIGATRWFIMGPFLVEGMLVVVIGTSLAVGVLAGLFHALPQEVVLFLSGPGGLEFLPAPVVAYMVAGGGALGFAGGLVSVNKFLE